jgi:hypothetical protein
MILLTSVTRILYILYQSDGYKISINRLKLSSPILYDILSLSRHFKRHTLNDIQHLKLKGYVYEPKNGEIRYAL